MRLPRSIRTLPLTLLVAIAPAARAQRPTRPTHLTRPTHVARAAATRAIVIDHGVLRWRDDGSEVALFGANYTLPSASDFRAAGYLGLDRKKLIDDDMAHFARMGWTALRLSFWGDWESSDTAGNLVPNAHLDLLDYLVARARERGIYVMLSPITTYEAGWPDSVRTPKHGLSYRFNRGELGTKPEAIAAQVRYLTQILEHVNPYTGIALGRDPAIPFVELVNEPWHHPEDLAGSVRYIDALADAVRGTGSTQIILYNVSQDFRIATAIRRSKAQGVTFGWYPSGLNSGHELEGNYLRAVDAYPPMLDSSLAGLPRLVYEFDTADLRTGYMYPAMARTFRAVGAQFATMFSYDMLGTASRNLGWQTHYLNLVYTPQKAISAVIAAEAMRRLPRGQSYGSYPSDTAFGDFRVSYEGNLAELVASDAFMYSNGTENTPPHRERLTRIAGYGSSPVVEYLGKGAYFLDKLGAGLWRLEVYPDAVPVRDPYEPPNPERIVTRAIRRVWPMLVRLPDLGENFTIQKIAGAPASVVGASGRGFDVTPGVYVLSAHGAVDRSRLPTRVGALRVNEFHAPPSDTAPMRVVVHPPTLDVGRTIEIGATVADSAPPDSVTLAIRRVGTGWFRRVPMRHASGDEWLATFRADSIGEGPVEYAITVVRGGAPITFPGGQRRRAWDWNHDPTQVWTMTVVPPDAPLPLFVPALDAPRLAFSRIGDAGRSGIYLLTISAESGQPVFHLELPRNGNWSPEDYTASLVVKDRVAARRVDLARAPRAVRVRVRAVGARAVVHLTLMERDGTSWSVPVDADSTWTDRTIPLDAFTIARGVLLPEGFPGEWNYWVGPASGRGAPGDFPHVLDVERVQLSLRRADLLRAGDGMGVEIASILLTFDAPHASH